MAKKTRELKIKRVNMKSRATIARKKAEGTFKSNLPKGADGRPLNGGGRKPGQQNRDTREAKMSLVEVFELLGGVTGMVKWANKSNENKTIFYRDMYMKLVPLQVKSESDDRYRDTTSEREALGRLLLGAISARDKREPERVPVLIESSPVRDPEPRLVVPVSRSSEAA